MSAPVGQPPANEDDLNVVKWYICRIASIVPEMAVGRDPHKGLYIGQPRPPNYVHESFSPRIITLGWCTFSVICILTIARVSLPLTVKNIKWGWDDNVYMLAAIIGQITTVSIILHASLGKAGSHAWDYTYRDLFEAARWGTLAQYLYYIGLALVKVSLTLWIRQAIGYSSVKWRIAINIFLAVTILYTMATIIVQPVALHPWSSGLNIIASGPKCLVSNINNFIPVMLSHSAANACLDFIMVFFPAILFWRLNCPKAKRIRLSLLYVFGIGTVATAVFRTKYSEVIAMRADSFWYSGYLDLVGLVEILLSFIVANTVTVNSLYVLVRDLITDAYRSRASSVTGADSDSSSSMRKARVPVFENRIPVNHISAAMKTPSGREERRYDRREGEEYV